MLHNKLLPRISSDPNTYSGKPCIQERRMWVLLVLDLLTRGES